MSKKLFVLVLVSVVSFTVLIFYNVLDLDPSGGPKHLCFLPPDPLTGAHYLEDVLLHEKGPGKGGRSIFFHETSCAPRHPQIVLNARQACAIESAAKANPDREVFVLFASPRLVPDQVTKPVQALLQYPNINLRNVDIWKYSEGTLIQEWMHEMVLFSSAYVNFHLSDYMRYLSLSRYGGTYLDMDVIVKANLNDVSGNFAGAESIEDVAAGIISFDDTHFGRAMGEMCLRDFQLNFSGEKWGNNGPGVITRVLNRICETNNTLLMTEERCHGFNVLPQSKCYAVPYKQWADFFNRTLTKDVLEAVRESVIVHFWNKFSIKRMVKVGDDSAYDKLAKEYCPRVYAAAGYSF